MKKELILLLTLFLVISLTPGVVLAEESDENTTSNETNEVDESPECSQNCCLALTPSCLACSECVSVEEFCLENPDRFGCEDEVVEIEIEVEIEDGIAEVEVEFSGGEFEFSLNTIDKEVIISEIITRTGLSDEEVRNNIEFEIDEIDEDTEEEIEIMQHKHGKKIRLLQLRAKITHAILRGQVVIDYLSEKDVSQDLISELQGILAELEILKEEIKEIPESDTKEEAITKFIDIKKESRDLVKQFRKKIWEITTEDERKEIKDRLHEKREEHKDKIKDIRSELKKLRNFLNSDEVKRLLKHLDVEDKRLIEAISSGSLTVDEIKTKLREHYNSLSEDQKRHSKARLRLKHAHDKKEIRIKIDKHKDGQIKRVSIRIKERADKLEKSGHLDASKRLRDISSNLENKRIKHRIVDSG